MPELGLVLTALIALALGAAVGAWVGARWARLGQTTELAAATAERDLLANQVAALGDQARDQQELAQTLAPLSSSLARVERQVAALEKDRAQQWGELSGHLTRAAQDGHELRSTTASLAGALRSSGVRGSWGEVQLKRVLEHAGMLHRVDFDTQVRGSNDEGAQVRPDCVVRLPGGRHLVIDAKAPAAALLTEGGGSEAEQAKALRAHVETLAGKRYWTAVETSPEFVVCFLPAEGLLASACRADPDLLDVAMNRRVVVATPTTLLAMLRAVALAWQQEALVGNAREVFAVGRDLYERLAKLSGATAKLGRTMTRAVEDYNVLVTTMERQVLTRARRLADLEVTDTALPVLDELDLSPRTLTAAELVEADAHDQLSRDQSGRVQSGRVQSGRDQPGRAQPGRAQPGRAQSGRAQLPDFNARRSS